jgi:hypothetical protein
MAGTGAKGGSGGDGETRVNLLGAHLSRRRRQGLDGYSESQPSQPSQLSEPSQRRLSMAHHASVHAAPLRANSSSVSTADQPASGYHTGGGADAAGLHDSSDDADGDAAQLPDHASPVRRRRKPRERRVSGYYQPPEPAAGIRSEELGGASDGSAAAAAGCYFTEPVGRGSTDGGGVWRRRQLVSGKYSKVGVALCASTVLLPSSPPPLPSLSLSLSL